MNSHRKLCWSDADVRCPFYIADSTVKRSICCEGYARGINVVSQFRTLTQREKHMGVYCVENYECCPMYRSTYECKYRGTETA